MDLLIPKAEYIKYRINKGNLEKNKKLDRFISLETSVGRNLFDISSIDNRLRIAAKFFDNKSVAVISTDFDEKYVKKFCEHTGFTHVKHYTASIFSNPQNERFFEPDLIFVTNIDLNRNAVEEANTNKIPVTAFSNTNSNISGLDFLIPLNTTSKKAIGVALWLITNEIKKARKEKEISFEDFMEAEGSEEAEEVVN